LFCIFKVAMSFPQPAVVKRLAAKDSLFRIATSAFTLVELLVVIAVVAILATLLICALNEAKSKGHSITCLSHERQLIVAWHVYSDENEGRVAKNYGITRTLETIANGSYHNWVNNVLDWSTDPMNTNRALLFAGGLGPYLSKQHEVYRCPSDAALSPQQLALGWRSRVRSYSMNAMVGDAGEFTTQGFNTNNPAYQQFFALTEIPQPSDIFVFIEEHPDSLRDGYFLNSAGSHQWTDLPASYHSGGANLVFADGHAEYQRWKVASTRVPPRPLAFEPDRTLEGPERRDFYWLMQRTSVRREPTATTPAGY
jgi:prepilin-type processing-associated H-X9-DG protein/prepilin-type N-terminal cleavage/methylation domain-containing protein